MIEICLAADRKYQQHLLITLSSVLLNADSSDRFNFIILSDGSIEAEPVEKLQRIKHFEFEIVNAHALVGQYVDISPDCRWAVSVYYRLLLPFIFPSISKILYLDCDTIVRTSLMPLWRTPMENASFAGVADHGFNHKDRLGRHGIELNGEYLNSGVSLLNLERIRNLRYQERLDSVQRRLRTPEFPDQDWMNLMFEHDKLVLPPQWNVMSHMFLLRPEDMVPYSVDEIAQAKSDPCICHYTNIKPWTMTYTDHPYWFEYWKCLNKSPYRGKIWKGYLKKMLLSDREGVFFRLVRPALKTLLRKA